MFTKLHFRIIKYIIHSSYSFGATPFKWNPKINRVYCTKISIKRCRIVALFFLGYTLFFGIRAFQLKYHQQQTQMNLFNLILVVTFALVLAGIALSLLVFKPIEYAAMINETYDFELYFHSKYISGLIYYLICSVDIMKI